MFPEPGAVPPGGARMPLRAPRAGGDRPMIIRRGAAWRAFVLASAAGAAALLAPPARGEEAPARQTFGGANGVTVEVRSDGPASDADVLRALEEAARAVRSRAAGPAQPAPPPMAPD